MRVALISLEPWDGVWRRNQHLSAELISQGLVESLVFVEPLLRNPQRGGRLEVPAGVEVCHPRLVAPKRMGGLRMAGARLRRSVLRDIDVLWINDPALGVHCLAAGTPAIYDVTDDWRTFSFPSRITRRIVRAEDRLARRAATVVCSRSLRERWQDRYAVLAPVVHNGIDVAAWRDASPVALPGTAPHVGYIGTLHADRLDVDLVIDVANEPAVGTVHLVGPDALDDASRRRIAGHPGVILHGAVPAPEVPGWTMAMDVLICPHRINDFTLSLDAIKAREYVASDRPVVATPTSGFQYAEQSGELTVRTCSTNEFAGLVATLVDSPRTGARPDVAEMSWSARAREFFDHGLAPALATPARARRKAVA